MAAFFLRQPAMGHCFARLWMRRGGGAFASRRLTDLARFQALIFCQPAVRSQRLALSNFMYERGDVWTIRCFGEAAANNFRLLDRTDVEFGYLAWLRTGFSMTIANPSIILSHQAKAAPGWLRNGNVVKLQCSNYKSKIELYCGIGPFMN